jgi:hypothetical protein
VIRTVDANKFLLAAVNAGLPAERAIVCVVGTEDGQFSVDDSCDECQFVKTLLLGDGGEQFCAPAGGPGTELKKLLAGWPFYITALPDCPCNARAAEMDRQEQQSPGWCEANIDTIVGWLREQAEARGLSFLDVAGRMLVRRAIRNARRNA